MIVIFRVLVLLRKVSVSDMFVAVVDLFLSFFLFFLPFDVISGNKFAWSSSHFSFSAVSHIFLAHI